MIRFLGKEGRFFDQGPNWFVDQAYDPDKLELNVHLPSNRFTKRFITGHGLWEQQQAYEAVLKDFFICTCCHRMENVVGKVTCRAHQMMIAYHYCWECACWLDIYDEDLSSKNWWNRIVIDGNHYRAHGVNQNAVQGLYGQRWTLRSIETGEIVHTNDLWTQGEVPVRWRPLFPDNVEVVR